MVGIVVVSHSQALAEGVVTLAREMGGSDLALEAAGGLEEPGVLGTDAERVRVAIERAMSDDGVLVLMDLGSALMSAEFAIEMLGDGARVKLSEAPLVEGAVAAAAAARSGASLEEVAAEARGALAMKASQLGAEEAPGAPAPAEAAPPADAEAALAVRNAIGLHARPAARFVEIARGFDAEVHVAKAGGGPPVRATSLTNVVALGARLGDTLLVSASGPQSAEALDALRALADEGFGDGLAVATPAPARVPVAEAPATPEAAPVAGDVLTGVAASGGVAIGPARHLRAPAGPLPERAAEAPEREREKLDGAIAAARDAIAADRVAVAERAGAAEAAIFDAHLALLDDEAMLEPAHAAIAGGATAERAWHDAAEQVADRYRALDEPLLRERAADVLDVGQRVVGALTGAQRSGPAEPGIVVAGELTPADAAGLDPALVRGIATAHGAATAHAAILARALGLPAVVGLGRGLLAVEEGTPLLLDGDAGVVQVDPPEDMLRDAEERRERAAQRRAAALERAHEPGATRDGARVEVFANLGKAREAAEAVELGAEGVGLLRTEFLFLDRPELPDEDEQVQTLRDIAVALDGRPLVVRTLDAGADKPLPALPMPPEANPFLGVRGIRLALQRRDVLATQLRAILRVAAEHPVKAMLPMVATLAEVRAARAVLDEAREATGIDTPLEFGIMVEVPAAALTAANLAEHVDFFSLGTNDLTQYTMAAERGDERLAPLLAGPQPAVLRLVRETVAAADAHGRWVGVCGELAGDPAAAILLAGLGVTELSMAPALIPEAKAALRAVDLSAARAAAESALEAEDADAAREIALSLL
ncbi:MAG TPA: phosphoenolpyruvate--protein phosphotransferase [Solirubrobacteraceae bacterium]|nr:phosphoenolpyruvate--protein phosphotransferase [Solirubrobacteraceae bacterium]